MKLTIKSSLSSHTRHQHHNYFDITKYSSSVLLSPDLVLPQRRCLIKTYFTVYIPHLWNSLPIVDLTLQTGNVKHELHVYNYVETYFCKSLATTMFIYATVPLAIVQE